MLMADRRGRARGTTVHGLAGRRAIGRRQRGRIFFGGGGVQIAGGLAAVLVLVAQRDDAVRAGAIERGVGGVQHLLEKDASQGHMA